MIVASLAPYIERKFKPDVKKKKNGSQPEEVQGD
jgi:hypothetical protein